MIHFEKITEQNLWSVVALSVADDQKTFVATNTESLLQAYVALTSGRTALAFAICEDDLPVGFILFGYGSVAGEGEDEPVVAAGNYSIWRFMIDRRYQHRGLGRAALAKAIAYVRTFPCGPASYCYLSYEPENRNARALYASMGFVENGERDGDEIVAVLPL